MFLKMSVGSRFRVSDMDCNTTLLITVFTEVHDNKGIQFDRGNDDASGKVACIETAPDEARA